jgi:hypothetical protein
MMAVELSRKKKKKSKIMKGYLKKTRIISAVSLGGVICAGTLQAQALFDKPAWLPELSLGFKESYDDNVLEVSGLGLKPQSSWITTVSPKVGLDFASLLGAPSVLQTASLSYTPDFVIYHGARSESYDAHKVCNIIKGKAGDFSFALSNAYLYNDGSTTSPLYALNQLSGAQGNQDDKYRNFFAQAATRERRNQMQDRASIVLQYDLDKWFFRPSASLLGYDLQTDWHNSTEAPYKGYQNWPSRFDVNGGTDIGFRLTPDLAVTAGYRYGDQDQQQLPKSVTTDSHYSSSEYQRALLGLEGHPLSWLSFRLTGGPDFRDYNTNAPVDNLHMVTYYGEAVVTATITTNQSLAFNYKQWQWVSATGIAPYFDSTYGLNYHWNATPQLGLDLGGKVLEADFTSGNDTAGSAPSLRDDLQYTVSGGINYAFTKNFSASMTGSMDVGANGLDNLAAKYEPDYRNFHHRVISLGMTYKF